jgi:hypothetical protein
MKSFDALALLKMAELLLLTLNTLQFWEKTRKLPELSWSKSSHSSQFVVQSGIRNLFRIFGLNHWRIFHMVGRRLHRAFGKTCHFISDHRTPQNLNFSATGTGRLIWLSFQWSKINLTKMLPYYLRDRSNSNSQGLQQRKCSRSMCRGESSNESRHKTIMSALLCYSLQSSGSFWPRILIGSSPLRIDNCLVGICLKNRGYRCRNFH